MSKQYVYAYSDDPYIFASVEEERLFEWEVTRVIDGDTVGIRVEWGPLELRKLSIRIRGIDTPEKGYRAKCEFEKNNIKNKMNLGYKGCRETNWLNDLDTNTAFIDRAGNSINGITLDARRVDIGIDSLNTYYEETVALSATTAMELGTTYKAFIGTRKYENFGEFMMFNFEENSTTGIHDRGQSNFTSSFSESERTNLNGALRGTTSASLAVGGNVPPVTAAVEEWTGAGASVTRTFTDS